MMLAAGAFFLVPLVAGASVRLFSPRPEVLRWLLSFSGSFLIGVAFLHLLPELYLDRGAAVGIWVLGGFLLQVVLEHFSMGIEHGHMHGVKAGTLPLLTLLSLMLHSFAEGIPFAAPNVAADEHFLAGVLLHKIPMAIALVTILQRAGTVAWRAWAAVVLFALAAPAGIWFGATVGDQLGPAFLQNMLGLAIGMLLHIGTTIIFESAPGHKVHVWRFAAVVLGALLSLLSMHS
jgi:zinc transporter ZupT